MAKVQEIGPYSAYAIAVKYGYKGTEEEWVKEQEANRKAAEAAAAAAAQSAKDAAASASGVAQSGQQAVQSIKDAQTAAEQAIDTAKQQAVQAAQAEAEKAATSAGQAASSAAEAAQSATNAAAEVGKVQSAGTSAVQAVQAAQNTATEAVSDAQQSATQAVSQAQTAAVSAVQEAGTTQTSAVASAASSALTNISGAKDAALSDVAEAGEAQASAVGTAGTSAVQGVNDAKTAALKEIEDANAALPSPTQSDAGKVPTVKADGSAYELAGPYAPLSAAIRPTANGNPVSITDSAEWPLLGLKVYGKSTQDGMPSPENSVPIVSAGDGGSVELAVTGANFLNYASIVGGTASVEILSDTSIKLTALSAGAYRQTGVVNVIAPPKNAFIYVSGEVDSSNPENIPFVIFRTYLNNSQIENIDIDIGSYGKTNKICDSAKLIISINQKNTANAGDYMIFKNLMVSFSADASFQAYQNLQSISLSTPSGLPGIPVESGGNYTDTSGQQSACDVKDYGTGKYTQMVGHIESYNGENITTPYMSTTGQLSTGAEVYYVLDEPVVTDISADELTAYRALHTYDGATVVSTAEDVAGLEVRYVANAQKYIDDRLAAAESHIQEIAAAQLNAQTGG